MVPGTYLSLKKLPLTSNGKVDRSALPVPQSSLMAPSKFGRASTRESEALCEIFAELLPLPYVGEDENFFQLGGHSLLAMQAVTRIRERLNVEVPVRDPIGGANRRGPVQEDHPRNPYCHGNRHSAARTSWRAAPLLRPATHVGAGATYAWTVPRYHMPARPQPDRASERKPHWSRFSPRLRAVMRCCAPVFPPRRMDEPWQDIQPGQNREGCRLSTLVISRRASGRRWRNALPQPKRTGFLI